MAVSSCDGANTNLMDSPSPSPSPPESTKSDHQASERNSSAMTIEFLRARLLSERSVSKSAKQQMQQMSQQISKLQTHLDMEIEQRKKAEGALEKVLKFLSVKGLSVDYSEKVEESLESIKEVDDHGASSDATGNTVTKNAVKNSKLHGNGEDSLSPDAHNSNDNNLDGKSKPQLDDESKIEVMVQHSSRSSMLPLQQNSQVYTDTSSKLKLMLYQIMEEVTRAIPKDQAVGSTIQALVDSAINLFEGQDVKDHCDNRHKAYSPAHAENVKDGSGLDQLRYSKQKESQTVNENLSMVKQLEKCIVTGEMQNVQGCSASISKGFDSQLKNGPILHARQTMQDPCKQGKTMSPDSAYICSVPSCADMMMHCATGSGQAIFTNGQIKSSQYATLRGSPYLVEPPHPGMHYHPPSMNYAKRSESMVKDDDVMPPEFYRKPDVNMLKDGNFYDMLPHEVYKKQHVVHGNFGMHRGYAYHQPCMEGPHSLTDERNGSRLGNILNVLQEARQCIREERTEDLTLESSSSSSSLFCGGYSHPERYDSLRRSRSVSSSSHYTMLVPDQKNLQSREVDLGNGITLYTD